LAADQFHYDAEVSAGMSIGGRSLAIALAKGVDPYLIDGTVNATGYAAGGLGLVLRKIQSGYVRFYAVVMLLGVVGLLGYMFYLFNTLTQGTGR
jgi:NADH-quinone oxidoreductase subunit L